MNEKFFFNELETFFIKNKNKLETADFKITDSDDNSLLKNQIITLIRNDDEKLLNILLENVRFSKRFFKKVGDIQVFNKDEFIYILENQDFLGTDYTKFQNKISLTNNKLNPIFSTNDVVLSFPFKDCILEGGQTEVKEKKQKGQGRKEVFYNDIIAYEEINKLKENKAFSNVKRYSQFGCEENVKEINRNSDEIINENLIIKGNNLLVLYTLRSEFAGKVKLMYWDILYNTGKDFRYNDKFNHETWLVFMKNRLEVARDLLAPEGVIFIQCDDNEMPYLKVLCDEIFKRKNFIQHVEMKANDGAANEYQNPFMPKNCEYGLIYAKNKVRHTYKPYWAKREYDTAYYKIVLNADEKDFTKWEISTVNKVIKEQLDPIIESVKTSLTNNNVSDKNLIKDIIMKIKDNYISNFVKQNAKRVFQTISPKNPAAALSKAMQESIGQTWSIYQRDSIDDILCYRGRMVRFYNKNLGKDTETGEFTFVKELGSLWTDISWTGIAKEGAVTLKNGKKPEKLLRRIIEMFSEEGDIVLDAFLGSATTCAVAHKMHRQYIGIEQMDYIEELSVTRLINVLNGDQTGVSKNLNWTNGGSFIYCELAKLNQIYTEQFEKATTEIELNNIFNNIKENSLEFISYKKNLDMFLTDDFKKLSLQEKKAVLKDVLDKNMLYINYSDMEDKNINIKENGKLIVNDNDRKFSKNFYKEAK